MIYIFLLKWLHLLFETANKRSTSECTTIQWSVRINGGKINFTRCSIHTMTNYAARTSTQNQPSRRQSDASNVPRILRVTIKRRHRTSLSVWIPIDSHSNEIYGKETNLVRKTIQFDCKRKWTLLMANIKGRMSTTRLWNCWTNHFRFQQINNQIFVFKTVDCVASDWYSLTLCVHRFELIWIVVLYSVFMVREKDL